MSDTVVLAAVRTPIGKLGGALAGLAATTLGAEAIRAAVERSGIAPEDIEHAIMGQVLQAGAGQAPSRQATFGAGLPKTVTSQTVNKVCASGLLALADAHRLIQSGGAATVVAGGMESMSQAPYLVPQARFGYRMGDGMLVDALVHDGLWCPYFQCTMAEQSEEVSAHLRISRAQQDQYALRSHTFAVAAAEQGRLADELIPLKVATKAKGRLIIEKIPAPRVAAPVGDRETAQTQTPDEFVAKPDEFSPYLADPAAPFTTIVSDEAPRKDTNLDALSKLRPISPGGSITAGNAPGVNDGAAALVLADGAYASAHGLSPLAKIRGHAAVAWDPPYLPLTPAMAAEKLLAAKGLSAKDVALWEINEAFAAVTLASVNRLGIDMARVNVDGGAIAIGHPLGCSGARIVGHLVHALRRRGGGLGMAAICSGGGQGDALLIEVD
ncbi:MAG: thiolase family protein [Candidatus Eremiobacteraeota bacterium]|nr:thiolase family protein [Candidatus Eremiobacteraeota bacterium]MBC5826286.1 thiolase family protein [Candidatus Eremiobacteraeota bacterium]